jgi:PKD repeat protein
MKKVGSLVLTLCLFTVMFTIIISERSSSEGLVIAYAGEDQAVFEGDVVQFNSSALYNASHPVWPVDISGDGRYLAVGWDTNVTFFSTSSNIPIWTYDTATLGRVGDLKLSEDGQFLVVGSRTSIFFFNTSSDIPLWSVDIGDPATVIYDGDPGNRLDMTREGRFVAAATAINRVLVYDTTSITPTIPYWDFTFGSEVNIVRFSRNGLYLSMGGKSGNLKLGWIPGKSINWTASAGDMVYSSSLSYSGDLISSGVGNAHKVKLYSSASPTPVWTHTLLGRQFEQVMSDDGEYLTSSNHYDGLGGTWNGFAFWDTKLSTPIWTYSTGSGYGSKTDAIDMDLNASFVVGGSVNNFVYLFNQTYDGLPGWSAADGTPQFIYDVGGSVNYNSVSLSYNGSYFASGSWDGSLYLFSTIGGPHLEWTWSTGNMVPVVDPTYFRWDFNNFEDTDSDGNFTNDVDALGPNPIHAYGDNGVYTVTLNVTDGMGTYGTDTLTVTVSNVAPIITPFGPYTVDECSDLDITGNAIDPGSDDLNFTWSFGDLTPNSVSVYYNDGIGNDPYPSPWGTYPLNINDLVSHIYYDEGIYTLNLTVEDDDGGVAYYETQVTVNNIPILPPILYINVSQNKDDIFLTWDPPPALDLNHYLIYRSTSQIGFDFDLIWVNTSEDPCGFEASPSPLRTNWTDFFAAKPDDPNYKKEYYYIIRAVNDDGDVSYTSRTVGKYTRIFPSGISSFSLPLEPHEAIDTDTLTSDMNAEYIKYINSTSRNWDQHDRGGGVVNNIEMKLGDGYEIQFQDQTNFTFCGMPGAMILYENISFGFDASPGGDAGDLTAQVNSVSETVVLSWQEPEGMGSLDQYLILRSTKRDGFWGIQGVDFIELATIPYNVLLYLDEGNATFGSQLYYMIVTINSSTLKRGSSSYSIGIWTKGFQTEYDTTGLPLKLKEDKTADWYCDNIPNCIGINYHNPAYQRWRWHSTRMPEGAFDTVLERVEGYQISTSGSTKFSFIGI